MAPEDNGNLERPYVKDSPEQVAEWRIVLEGMDGQSRITGGFNLTVAIAVTGRTSVVESDPVESHKEVSSDFPHDDHDRLNKVSFIALH